MQTSLYTTSQPFKPVLAASAGDTTFATLAATRGTPANTIEIGDGGSISQNLALAVLFGTDTATQTFDFRFVGWSLVKGGGSKVDIWIPVPLVQGTATLSTFKGGIGSTPADTDFLVDTITLAAPFTSKNSIEAISPAGNIPAHVVFDMKGCQRLGLQVATNGSAITANAIAKQY